LIQARQVIKAAYMHIFHEDLRNGPATGALEHLRQCFSGLLNISLDRSNAFA